MLYHNLIWDKAYVRPVQGIKNNRIPENAVKGGQGSFLVEDRPATLTLELKDEDGKHFQIIEILDLVKELNDWKRISQKRVDALSKKLEETGSFNIDDLPDILTL